MANRALVAMAVCCVLVTNPPIGATQDTPPSVNLVRGLEAYAQERYAVAAVQLQQVVQGETGDSPERVQQAQLTLGKALLHLGFHESALRVFDEITRTGRDHPHFAESLGWLSELAARVPEPSTVAVLVGRYQASDLQTLEPAVRDRLLLMLGRDAYDRRELPLAIDVLEQIGTGTPQYVHARLLVGISHVRARHARQAIAAFREVLRALDAGDAGAGKDRAGFEDLAWLSLGRIYYTAAFSGGKAASGGAGHGDASVRGQLLGSAVDAWSRVSEGGEYWLDALFESSWALFVSDQHARALGNIHGLLSPYFKGAFYPEAYVIKAVAFYHSCQMDNAMAVIDEFHTRYSPLLADLAVLPARMEGDGALSLVAEVMSTDRARHQRASSEAPEHLRSLLMRTLDVRDVRRARAQLDALEAQQRALDGTDASLRSSAVGTRIEQDLVLAESFAREQVSALVRAKVARLLSELQDISNQIDTVEIEILNWQRQTIDKPPMAPRGGGGEVNVDSEHVVWPFNGEYWRDELPYYRQQVTDRCPAR
jgi:tetratricopeptide (TPR) repeat protein